MSSEEVNSQTPPSRPPPSHQTAEEATTTTTSDPTSPPPFTGPVIESEGFLEPATPEPQSNPPQPTGLSEDQPRTRSPRATPPPPPAAGGSTGRKKDSGVEDAAAVDADHQPRDESTNAAADASSGMTKLQELLSGGAGILTEEEIASEHRVVSEIISRMKKSLVRQDRHHMLENSTRKQKGHNHSHRVPPNAASRSFLIPCIFDGHKSKNGGTTTSTFPTFSDFDATTNTNRKLDLGSTLGGMSTATGGGGEETDIQARTLRAEEPSIEIQREARLRSLMDGIISFQSLLQLFHDDLFGALDMLGKQFVDSDGSPLGKKSMNVSMSCVHLKEAKRPTTGASSSTKNLPEGVKVAPSVPVAAEGSNGDDGHSTSSSSHVPVVVTQAFDCGEASATPTKPELHYNHPFLDTTVHTTTQFKDGKVESSYYDNKAQMKDISTPFLEAETNGASFFVPRWSCGRFHTVSSPEDSSRMLNQALEVFHSNLSTIYQQEDEEDEAAAEREASEVLGSTAGSSAQELAAARMEASLLATQRRQQKLETSSETLLIQYRILRCNGDAVELASNSNTDDQKDNRRLFSTVLYFVLTPSTGSFISGLKRYEPSVQHAPAAKGRSAAVLESMRRAFDAASQSFWHPLLDEVIVHNVASLTAVGAGEGEEGKVAPATHAALNFIRNTLASEQKKLFKKHRENQKAQFAGQQRKANQALFCHSPPDGMAAEKVLAKAKVAIGLAASIMDPYKWMLELLHPELKKLSTLDELITWVGKNEDAKEGDAFVDDSVGATMDSALLLDATIRDIYARHSPTKSGSFSPKNRAGSPIFLALGSPKASPNKNEIQKPSSIGEGAAESPIPREQVDTAAADDNDVTSRQLLAETPLGQRKREEVGTSPTPGFGTATKGTSCEPLDTSSHFVTMEEHEDMNDQHEAEKAQLLEDIERLRKINQEWASHFEASKDENNTDLAQLRWKVKELEIKNEKLEDRNKELEDLEAERQAELARLAEENAALEQRLALFAKMNEVTASKLQEEKARADQATADLASSPTLADFEKSFAEKNRREEKEFRDSATEIGLDDFPCDGCIERARALFNMRPLETQTDATPTRHSGMVTQLHTVLSQNVQTSQDLYNNGEILGHGGATLLENRGVSPIPHLGVADTRSGAVSPIPQVLTFDFGGQTHQSGEDMDELSKSRIEAAELERRNAEGMAKLKVEHAKELLRLTSILEPLQEKYDKLLKEHQELRDIHGRQSKADSETIKDLNEQLEQSNKDKINIMRTLRAIQQARQDDMDSASRASSIERDHELESERQKGEREEERRRVRILQREMEKELERLKKQIEGLEAQLYDANSRNQTLTKLIAIYEKDGSAQGDETHFHAHCSHPSIKPSPLKYNPDAPPKPTSQVSKNPKASDQLSTLSITPSAHHHLTTTASSSVRGTSPSQQSMYSGGVPSYHRAGSPVPTAGSVIDRHHQQHIPAHRQVSSTSVTSKGSAASPAEEHQGTTVVAAGKKQVSIATPAASPPLPLTPTKKGPIAHSGGGSPLPLNPNPKATVEILRKGIDGVIVATSNNNITPKKEEITKGDQPQQQQSPPPSYARTISGGGQDTTRAGGVVSPTGMMRRYGTPVSRKDSNVSSSQ